MSDDEAALLRDAVSFTAHFRKSPHESYTLCAGTLAEARELAQKLDDAHGANGRRAAVYAVTADHRRVFIPADY